MTARHYVDGNPFRRNVRLLTAIAERARINGLLGRRGLHRQHDPYNEPAMWCILCGPGAGGWEFRR